VSICGFLSGDCNIGSSFDVSLPDGREREKLGLLKKFFKKFTRVLEYPAPIPLLQGEFSVWVDLKNLIHQTLGDCFNFYVKFI
jgi:hypothetical protein